MPVSTDFLYYRSVDEAIAELQRRKEDARFCSFVDEVFGLDIPAPFRGDTPRAVFARFIASPTFEFEAFYGTATAHGMAPLMLEFTSDKLVARNYEKYALCRMAYGRKAGPNIQKTRVDNLINFNTDEGKPLSSITTKYGPSLVDFHHDLMNTHLAGRPLEVHDFSDWFVPNRGSDRWSYYLRYLGLFLHNAILFENFLSSEREAAFTEEIVIPAFRTITDVAGCSPLIVPAIPRETEDELYWCYYDEKLRL